MKLLLLANILKKNLPPWRLNKQCMLVFLISFFIRIFFPTQALAQSNSDEYFAISLSADYEVAQSGETTVRQNFTIENKTPEYFIEEYAIVVGSNQLNNVTVQEKGKNIPANVVNTDNQTSISIHFDTSLVGSGKQRTFTVSYRSNDIASINGKALEVSIPRLSKEQNFTNYSVNLRTPLEFGGPSKTAPTVNNWVVSDGQILTSFKNLKTESVVAFFGHEQYFDIDLRYNLENPTDSPGILQIALPPDTIFQTVYIYTLDPLPKEIKRDIDGNWLATYRLQAKERLLVHSAMQVKIELEPRSDYIVNKPTQASISKDNYWPSDAEVVQNTARQLNDVEEIYDYVVDTLKYNYQKFGENNKRLGAVQVLRTPSNASCQEFTDLFVTLMRNKGLAARRVTGYAHTQNEILRPLSLVEDVLHSWPEYFDTKRGYWVPIDPTWENTTGGINFFDEFDLNHVTFAINGQSSERPYPAGTYKIPGEESGKDVEVRFSDSFPALESEPFEISLAAENINGLPWRGRYIIKIHNQSGRAWYGQNISLTSNSNSHIKQNINSFDILPFETVELPISIQENDSIWGKQVQLTVDVANSQESFTVKDAGRLDRWLWSPYGFAALGFASICLPLAAGSLLVLRRKQ